MEPTEMEKLIELITHPTLTSAGMTVVVLAVIVIISREIAKGRQRNLLEEASKKSRRANDHLQSTSQ
jgi:hypothetical protein